MCVHSGLDTGAYSLSLIKVFDSLVFLFLRALVLQFCCSCGSGGVDRQLAPKRQVILAAPIRTICSLKFRSTGGGGNFL